MTNETLPQATNQKNENRDTNQIRSELVKYYGEEAVSEMEQRTPGILQLESLFYSLGLEDKVDAFDFSQLCKKRNLIIPKEAFDSRGQLLPLFEDREAFDKKGIDENKGKRHEYVYIGDRYPKNVQRVLNALKCFEDHIDRTNSGRSDEDEVIDDDSDVNDENGLDNFLEFTSDTTLPQRKKSRQIADYQERDKGPNLDTE